MSKRRVLALWDNATATLMIQLRAQMQIELVSLYRLEELPSEIAVGNWPRAVLVGHLNPDSSSLVSLLNGVSGSQVIVLAPNHPIEVIRRQYQGTNVRLVAGKKNLVERVFAELHKALDVELRVVTRHPLAGPVVLLKEGERLLGFGVNVSVGGILLRSDQCAKLEGPIEVGQRWEAAFTVERDGPQLRLPCKILRRIDEGNATLLACSFERLGAEQLEELQRQIAKRVDELTEWEDMRHKSGRFLVSLFHSKKTRSVCHLVKVKMNYEGESREWYCEVEQIGSGGALLKPHATAPSLGEGSRVSLHLLGRSDSYRCMARVVRCGSQDSSLVAVAFEPHHVVDEVAKFLKRIGVSPGVKGYLY